MSINLNLGKIEYSKRQAIHKDLEIKIEKDKFRPGFNTRYIYPYELFGEKIALPFSYCLRSGLGKRPTRETFPVMKVVKKGCLRDYQKVVRKEALQHLNKRGSTIISCHCGWGKTFFSIHMAADIRLPTLIIVNKLVLMKQWKKSIEEFTENSKIQMVKTNSKKENNVDFYIVNCQNIPKIGRSFFKRVGTVICDEAHCLLAESLSKSMTYLNPRYLIALSATPYRVDGLDILLEHYFGTQKIVRELHREHIVYCIKTGFTPKVELAINGRVNWGKILDSQSSDKGRNTIIIRIVKKYPNRNFLILTKRVNQGKYLNEEINKEGISCDTLIGNKQLFDENSRVLIGTSSKIGTGFDHKKLDALILASDVEEYFIQYLGRVFRRKDVVPIIFDLVDNNKILKRHYNTRRSIYIKHGGKIKNVDLKKSSFLY
jgi:superfamily II DNA or RNA helicase